MAMDARDVFGEHSKSIRVRVEGSPPHVYALLDKLPPGVRGGECIPDNISPFEWITESRDLESRRRELLITAESITFYSYYSTDPEHVFFNGPPAYTANTEAAIRAKTRLISYVQMSYPSKILDQQHAMAISAPETITNFDYVRQLPIFPVQMPYHAQSPGQSYGTFGTSDRAPISRTPPRPNNRRPNQGNRSNSRQPQRQNGGRQDQSRRTDNFSIQTQERRRSNDGPITQPERWADLAESRTPMSFSHPPVRSQPDQRSNSRFDRDRPAPEAENEDIYDILAG